MKDYPFPLQPMTFSNFIENALKIYRKNWKKIIPVSLAVTGSFMFIMQIVINLQILPLLDKITQEATLITDFNDYITRFMGSRISESLIWLFASVFLLSLLSSLIITPFIIGYVSRVASVYFHGDEPDVKTISLISAKGIGRLILTMLAGTVISFGIVSVFTGAIFLSVIATMTLTPFFGVLVFFVALLMILVIVATSLIMAFSYQITIHERTCGFPAIARSFRMISRKFWFSLGLVLATGLIISVISSSITGFTGMFTFLSPFFSVISALITAVVYGIMVPFGYIVYALLYIDLKIEHENYYVDLMMDEK